MQGHIELWKRIKAHALAGLKINKVNTNDKRSTGVTGCSALCSVRNHWCTWTNTSNYALIIRMQRMFPWKNEANKLQHILKAANVEKKDHDLLHCKSGRSKKGWPFELNGWVIWKNWISRVCTKYEQSTVCSKRDDNFHGAQTLFTLNENPYFMVLSGSSPAPLLCV